MDILFRGLGNRKTGLRNSPGYNRDKKIFNNILGYGWRGFLNSANGSCRKLNGGNDRETISEHKIIDNFPELKGAPEPSIESTFTTN